MPSCRSLPAAAGASPHHAFTLIELLVVIGIIVILIAILLPVVNSVRKSANFTATKNQISTIAGAIEAYYGDYHSYPGPFSDNQIDTNGAAPNTWTVTVGTTPLTLKNNSIVGLPSALNPSNVTSSENLVLGLSGGLNVAFSSAATPVANAFYYSGSNVNSGPQVLNTLISAQKQVTAYYTPSPAEISPSDLKGGYQAFTTAGTVMDTVIPEYCDHIPGNAIGSGGGVLPNPNCQYGPILYMRARVSTTGLVNEKTLSSGYVSAGSAATGFQYNFNQLMPYGFTDVPNVLANQTKTSGNPLNVPDDSTDFPLPSTNPPTGTTLTYDATTVYFANAAIAGQPKGKDAFLLIDAGTDRIFGTKDDIVYGN